MVCERLDWLRFDLFRLSGFRYWLLLGVGHRGRVCLRWACGLGDLGLGLASGDLVLVFRLDGGCGRLRLLGSDWRLLGLLLLSGLGLASSLLFAAGCASAVGASVCAVLAAGIASGTTCSGVLPSCFAGASV